MAGDIAMKRRSYEPERRHEPKVLYKGDLLVTGDGSIVVTEKPLKRCRPLLIHSEEVVIVRFKEDECVPPPCVGTHHRLDELDWEAFEREPFGELFIRIKWRVSSARTVEWCIIEVE